MNTVRIEWGLACPKCQSDEHLQVQLVTMADLTPDGTEPGGDQEWTPRSFMRCAACGYEGRVSSFDVDEVKP